MTALSRSPINDRRGKVYRIVDDNRTGEWLNVGVTMKPRPIRARIDNKRRGKSPPSYNREVRKVRHSLADRLKAHVEHEVDGSGKQLNLHMSEPRAKLPGSENPRKH